ncbi:MAG: septal ring lytic transglycosylase RlpA family protein [Gammaproteobacteria bacterium]
MLRIISLFSLALLIGCASSPKFGGSDKDSAPASPQDVSNVPEPTPKHEAYSKYGNPTSYKALGREYKVWDTHLGYEEEGIASWYGTKFHGKRTSSGEAYDMYSMTAAHKNLPIPSYVRVTNLDNNKSTVVRVNDRGPFATGRIIDLSYAAAAKLGILNMGTGRVKVEAIDAKNHPKRLPEAPAVAQEPVYVQVAAFSNQHNAQQLVEQIKNHTDKLVKIDPHSSLYRVHVGPFGSESELNAFKNLMSSMNLGSGFKVLR